jgi:hypothetical protein
VYSWWLKRKREKIPKKGNQRSRYTVEEEQGVSWRKKGV